MIFKKYFEVLICDTEESKKIHHNIRYKVYCEELGYEDKEKFTDKLEKDEYDEFSTLFIVKYKPTEEYVAAFRIIEASKTKLPIEDICTLHEDIDYKSIEISRVCVLKHFRLKKDSKEYETKIQRTILKGIIESGSEYAYNNFFVCAYWLINPALYKLLKNIGLNMVLIGEPKNHNGIRYPYKATINDVPASFHKQFLKQEGYEYFSQSKK